MFQSDFTITMNTDPKKTSEALAGPQAATEYAARPPQSQGMVCR